MCLGVPGKILSIEPDPLGMTMGKVSFGGVAKEVCLAYTPEAAIGDYVIVHAGFALNMLNEDEAQEVFALLAEIGLDQNGEAGIGEVSEADAGGAAE